jgi:thioredoxin-like negative regulator of GroEL
VKITRLNLDRNPLTAQRYQVLSTPTLLLFNRGKLINTLVGALPEAEIERHLGYLIH